MKRTLFISAFLMGVAHMRADLAQGEAGRIADAIYQAEGGSHARAPYGILSVRVNGEAEARQVCLRTIHNNFTRWESAGSPGEYIDWLADRYCPRSVDPIGNQNWKRNVKALLKKG